MLLNYAFLERCFTLGLKLEFESNYSYLLTAVLVYNGVRNSGYKEYSK